MKKIIKNLMLMLSVAGIMPAVASDIDKSLAQLRGTASQLQETVKGVQLAAKLLSKQYKTLSSKSVKDVVKKKVADKATLAAKGFSGACEDTATELNGIVKEAMKNVYASVLKELATSSEKVAQMAGRAVSTGAMEMIKTALVAKRTVDVVKGV
ncbi:hypothetical protein ACFLY6_01855 [Candidatus Dependentiae bacterium]